MEREIRRNKQFQYNQEKKGENIQRVKQNSLPSSSQDNSLFRSNKEIDDYLDKIKRVKQNSLLVRSNFLKKHIDGVNQWLPWDVTPSLITPTSKEKLETFLKEVGGRSPFYYKNSSDRELMKQKKNYWIFVVYVERSIGT